MKRILALILVLAMVATFFAACGKSADAPAADAPAADAPAADAPAADAPAADAEETNLSVILIDFISFSTSIPSSIAVLCDVETGRFL